MDRAQPFLPMLGPLCALGSSITWAFAVTVYTQSASRIGALRTNLMRSLIVLPLFTCSALLVSGPRSFLLVSPWQLGWLGLSALCSYALGDLVFYMAAMRLGTPTALAIASIYPAWAVLGGALTLGEVVGPLRIVGTLLCVYGVAWLVLQQRSGRQAAFSPGRPHARRDWIIGVLLSLSASVFWAGNTYSIRRGAVGQHFLLVNAFRYLVALLVMSLAQRVLRSKAQPEARLSMQSPSPKSLSPRFVITVLIEAFGGSSIFVYGLSHSELSVAAPLTALAPLFAVPIGLLLRTETLNPRRLAAILITVAGVVLLVR